MKRMFLLVAALAVAGAVSARAEDAKALYDGQCAKCHGPDGMGKTKMGEKLGVPDYTDAKVQDKMKDEEMAKAIKEGVTKDDKRLMKAFGDSLSDGDIKALVKYIRAFKK